MIFLVLCIIGSSQAEYMLRLLQRNRSNCANFAMCRVASLRTLMLPMQLIYIQSLAYVK